MIFVTCKAPVSDLYCLKTVSSLFWLDACSGALSLPKPNLAKPESEV